MKKGFTFIELVLLVLCVSTLATLTVAKASTAEEFNDTGSCRRNMLTIATAETMYYCKYDETGSLENLAATGILVNALELECPTEPHGGYIYEQCSEIHYCISCPNFPGGQHGGICSNATSWQ